MQNESVQAHIPATRRSNSVGDRKIGIGKVEVLIAKVEALARR